MDTQLHKSSKPDWTSLGSQFLLACCMLCLIKRGAECIASSNRSYSVVMRLEIDQQLLLSLQHIVDQIQQQLLHTEFGCGTANGNLLEMCNVLLCLLQIDLCLSLHLK